MTKISRPSEINAVFAEAFNSRDIARLLSLYEPDAALRPHDSAETVQGRAPLRAALEQLIRAPGHMTSCNVFCTVCGDIALLRADWVIRDPAGATLAQGSSAEVARRQSDGGWLYVIDRALE